MTKPGDPQKGKAAEKEQAQQAAKDAAAEAAARKPADEAAADVTPDTGQDETKPAEAEGTAAETTGVDKAGAEAAAVSEPAEPQEAAAPAEEPAAAAETPKPKKAKKPAAKADKADVDPKAQAAGKGARTASKGSDKKGAEATKAKPRKRRDEQPAVIVRAQAKYVRTSPRKARLVCDHIRGKSVAQARAILAFSPRAVSEAWSKLLESAVANAENNHELDGDDLKIHAIYADAGPTIKRFRPRAMGRATRIRKRTSHLTIQLTPMEQPSSGSRRST